MRVYSQEVEATQVREDVPPQTRYPVGVQQSGKEGYHVK